MRFLPVLMLFAFGCGTKPSTPATVEGSVTFLGRPLVGGLVVFTPDRDRGTTGKPTTAEIVSNGRYGMPVTGLTPGWYRVSISDPPSWYAVEGFPASLRRPDRSGLSREIVAGRDHRFDFHIEAGMR
jgi:hypothetical protein